MSIRLLIVDDHPLIRVGLRTLLEHMLDQPQIVEASDGREAIEIAATLKPHIVLLDISMPGLNGLDAARRLTSDLPSCKVIMLSMQTNPSAIRKADTPRRPVSGSPSTSHPATTPKIGVQNENDASPEAG